MTTKLKQYEVNTDNPRKADTGMRMPHERDESDDSQESAPRRDIKQAYDDLMKGQVDTDLRETRGVDAVVNNPPGPSPRNPNDQASPPGKSK